MRPSLALNFVGVNVADFQRSFDFYTRVLGIESTRSSPGWAWFETRGMMFELFGDAQAAAGARRPQAVRPVLCVADVPGVTRALLNAGAPVGPGKGRGPDGEPTVELTAPEEVRWLIAEVPALMAVADARHPPMGWVVLTTHDMPGQRAFYGYVLGLRLVQGTDGRTVGRQAPGEVVLVFEPDGVAHAIPRRRHQVPIFLSFEARDLQQATAWLTYCGIRVVAPVTEHEWGTDLFVADADGNPVQIVEYRGSGLMGPSIPRPTD